MTTYLSRTEVAERLGVTPRGLASATLPDPDVRVGRINGWKPETIDAWNATRPGRGNRTNYLPGLAAMNPAAAAHHRKEPAQ